MALFSNFPYTDFENLNLDWIIKTVKEYIERIDKVEVDVEEVKEYVQTKIKEIETYVDDYFDNLDVQEEINNKLEEMYESGELSDIIQQYLQVSSLLTFNTKNDLKNATNLIGGVDALTLGGADYLDGKTNLYKIRTITSGDVVDEDKILSLTNYPTLIAEKIPSNYLSIATPEKYGAVGDGVTDDTIALQQCINENDYIIGKGIYNISSSLTLDLDSKTIDLNSIKASFNDYIIKMSKGVKTVLNIRELRNSVGGGILFNNDELFEVCTINIDFIQTKAKCVSIENTKGILDCTFNSTCIESTNDIALNIEPKSSSYIGQCKLHFGRIVSLTNIGINIDSTNGYITGLDFGYCSLESSNLGICINAGGTGIENIYGTFRVIENTQNNKIALKLEGTNQRFQGLTMLHFDYIKPSSIDLSNFSTSAYQNINPHIKISGQIISGDANIILTNEAYIAPNGLRFKPILSRNTSVATNDSGVALRNDWKTNGRVPIYIAVAGGVSAITLPSYWDGSQITINNTDTITVRYYYNNNDTDVAQLSLSSGKHTIIGTYNNAGTCELREI